MDLTFRGTKLSQIENFRVFCVLILRMRFPQYYVKYINYISVLIYASPMSHIVCACTYVCCRSGGFQAATELVTIEVIRHYATLVFTTP